MAPNAEGRRCERCASSVIDLRRVTRSHAESIVRASGGKVCGRVRVNERGDAVFAAEPSRAGLMPVALAGLLAACSAEPTDPPQRAEVGVVDGAAPAVITIASTGAASFGGSLATGVMMPIGAPAAPVLAAPAPTPAQIEEPVEPTPEQRALTRRKHQQQHPPTYTRPIREDMGMMLMSDW